MSIPSQRTWTISRPTDELFIELTGDRPIRVLTTARSNITGKDYPMAFVFNYEKGRVFHTTLGHDAKAIRMSGDRRIDSPWRGPGPRDADRFVRGDWHRRSTAQGRPATAGGPQ